MKSNREKVLLGQYQREKKVTVCIKNLFLYDCCDRTFTHIILFDGQIVLGGRYDRLYYKIETQRC